MAYDENLAARIRALLSDREDVAERPMFGGLTFMLGGHMCCGVNKDDLTGRRMRGFVHVRPEGLKGPALKRWVGQAVAHAEALPPRQPARKGTGSR